MTASETTGLLGGDASAGDVVKHGSGTPSLVTCILVALQGILILFFLAGTKYAEEPYQVKEYIAFRDIMAMLLLGFGYLMTFLKHYGLGAVGFTMMLSVLAMELNIAVELLVRYLYGQAGSDDTTWPMP